MFKHSAWIEVMFRRIALSSDRIKRVAKMVYAKLAKQSSKETGMQIGLQLWDYIDSLHIQNGDILLVHSSMDGLRGTGITPKAIIDRLLTLVGEDGTLVFPAYPVTNRPDLFPQFEKQPLKYDPLKTPCWAGLLPNVFLRYPGVLRSEFPHNSLAAKGPASRYMMKDNLLGKYPHGEHSSWKYCVEHHAKVLFFGVDMIRSNTLLHAAEDISDENWPIRDWYSKTRYEVQTRNGIEEKDVYVCKAQWLQYAYTQRYTYLLERSGLLSRTVIGGIPMGYIRDAKLIVDKMVSDAQEGKIRYIIPKKYWKRKTLK